MFRDEEELVRFVKRLDIQAEPDPVHRDRLRERMLAAFREAGSEGAAVQRPQGSGRIRIGRFLMRSKPFKIGMAAAVAVCAVIAAALWTGNGGSGVALADVLAKMEQARTVCFKMVISRDGQPEEVYDIMYKEPGLMRSEAPGMINIIDWPNGRLLALMTKEKVAHRTDVAGMDNPYHRDWYADLKEIIGNEGAEPLGRCEVNGRPALGWRVVDEDGTCTVWADVHSGELLRAEFRARGSLVVLRDFVLDKELDDSLFRLDPPAGYRMMGPVAEFKQADTSVDDVAFLLRVWASANDGRFPDKLEAMDFQAVVAKAKWQQLGVDSQDKSRAAQDTLSRAFHFLYSRFDWTYAGKGILVDQQDAAVFWYKPKDSPTYKVVYADFSIRDVAEGDLPSPAGGNE
ncbi:MAG: hypothetical protein JXL80_03740 [Planctomycetes bacterium]|nr:hypothetical protein [Planctomycetota bacterium]